MFVLVVIYRTEQYLQAISLFYEPFQKKKKNHLTAALAHTDWNNWPITSLTLELLISLHGRQETRKFPKGLANNEDTPSPYYYFTEIVPVDTDNYSALWRRIVVG